MSTQAVKVSRFLMIMLGCLVLAGAAGADVVVLKSGERIEGTIRDALCTEKQVVISEPVVGGARLRIIQRADIRRIERGDAAGEAAGEAAGADQDVRPLDVGYVQCVLEKGASAPDRAALGEATVKGLEEALKKKDDLVVLELNGVAFAPTEVRAIMEVVALAVGDGQGERMAVYVVDAPGATALLPLAFPRIALAPEARLRGPSRGALNEADRSSIMRMLSSCAPRRVALAEAFCGGTSVRHDKATGWTADDGGTSGERFHAEQGVLQLSRFDAVSTGLAVGSCSDLKSIHQPLKLASAPTYRNRTVRTAPVGASNPSAAAVQAKRQIDRFNEGLAEGKEGAEMMLARAPSRDYVNGRPATLFEAVESTWVSSTNKRRQVKEIDKKAEKKALGLINKGLRQARVAAQTMEKYLRQGMQDARFDQALSSLAAIDALYFAIKNDNDPNGFPAKCRGLKVLKPL